LESPVKQISAESIQKSSLIEDKQNVEKNLEKSKKRVQFHEEPVNKISAGKDDCRDDDVTNKLKKKKKSKTCESESLEETEELPRRRKGTARK
jgi:hypothetical protein